VLAFGHLHIYFGTGMLLWRKDVKEFLSRVKDFALESGYRFRACPVILLRLSSPMRYGRKLPRR
jgi:hypothetical protein